MPAPARGGIGIGLNSVTNVVQTNPDAVEMSDHGSVCAASSLLVAITSVAAAHDCGVLKIV
jgi:hypothetical protein